MIGHSADHHLKSIEAFLLGTATFEDRPIRASGSKRHNAKTVKSARMKGTDMTETDKPKEGVVEEVLPTNIAKQGEAADAAQKAIIDAGKPGDKKTGDLIDPDQALDTKDEKKPEEKPVEPAKEEPKEGTLDWYKQRYTVLQGKYDSEIPSLHATIRQQTDTIELLNTAYDDMKAQFDELKATGGEQEDTTDTTGAAPGQVDPEKFEGYGAEMIELVNTTNKLLAENARLKAGFTETAKLKAELTNVSEKVEVSTWNDFTSALTGAVADWQQINASQDWLVWLGQPDAMSGVKRDDLLRNATTAYDVTRTVNIINAFKQEKGLPINGSAPVAKPKENPLGEQILPDNASGEVVPDDTLPAGFKRSELVTTADLTVALKQAQTGRITETEYNKISNQYQKQVNAGIRI